jgi:hypothetical protein
MNEWQALLELGEKEMLSLKIGTNIQLRSKLMGQIWSGVIIDIELPIGICAPRYKCRWRNGEESGFLLGSELKVI